jgi:biopolymer transport protein ExbD
MAEVVQQEGGGKQKGKRRMKRHSTHIDMTPMVDLACLLLTFFMLTTAFSKPKVMEVIFPEKSTNISNAPQVDDRRALTIILIENDKVLWYNGLADPTKESLPTLTETDFSDEGIRRVLLSRNKNLYERIDSLNTAVLEGTLELPQDTIAEMKKKMMQDDNVGPVVLIKAYENVKYKNMVDIIDEMTITNIARYAVTDLNFVENKMISNYFAAKSSGAASK